MSRKELPLIRETIVPCDLEAFVNQATALNQRNAEMVTTPFPKAPHRWLSHDQFTPRPITFTAEGEVEGGLSGLLGAVIDFSFTRSLCVPSYSSQGGHCYDPASLCFLEVAVRVDGDPDSASFCNDLRQQDKGRSYRDLAGLHQAIPGEDDLSHFRRRGGTQAIEAPLATFVDFCRAWGLIRGERLATDGQLEPSYSRFQGCAHFCQACQQFPLDERDLQELRHPLHSGVARLQLLCPFPDVVEKVQQATTKAGKPHEPKVTILEVAYVPAENSQAAERQEVAALLGLSFDAVPPLRIRRGHLTSGPQGERWGHCPRVLSDLEARVGYHVDTQDPSKKERVFGYLHQRTTDINVELGLELSVGHSTYPANANEGTHFPEHRAKGALPVLPHQLQLGDAGYDHIENYQWIRGHGGIPIIDYNPRNEHLGSDALRKRGYDHTGTLYAPCGRLCRSNGYDFAANSRQDVCGLPCPPEEQAQCRYGHNVRGYSHRMSFKDHPRLIGPIQRGTPAWKRLYAARTASERSNSYDQEVIGKGRAPKLRGLAAFRFAGAIRTLAHLLRRACTFVLDATHTLGKLQPLQT